MPANTFTAGPTGRSACGPTPQSISKIKLFGLDAKLLQIRAQEGVGAQCTGVYFVGVVARVDSVIGLHLPKAKESAGPQSHRRTGTEQAFR